jgi:tetratricopeptide (TPR) repeat protein
MRLYLCYAPEDKTTAFDLTDKLEKAGYPVAFDDVLHADQPLQPQLAALIDECQIFVYLVTAHSRKSEWCQWEFATAAELGKPIVTLAPEAFDNLEEVRGRIAYAPPTHPTDAPPKAANPAGTPSRTVALPTVVLTELMDAGADKPVLADKKPPLRWWLAGAIVLIAILLIVALNLPGLLTPIVPTATPTPVVLIISPTPRPAPTLLPGQPFPPETTGLVVMPPDDAAQAIIAALERAGLPYQRLDDRINTREDVERITTAYNAAGIVYGEYFAEGVQVYFELQAPAQTNAAATGIQPLTTFTLFGFFNRPYLSDFLRGLALYQEGEFAAAIAAFNQAETILPADRLTEVQPGGLYWYRGAAHHASGDFAAALEDFNQVLAVLPENATAFGNRAAIFYALQAFDEALADYDRALALLPEDAPLYYQRGNAHFSLEQYEQALADYNQAIILNPDFAPAYNNRGTVYARQNQLDSAIADFNRALRLLPDYQDGYRNRALAYRLQGDADNAIADYTRLLELVPDEAAAYLARGRLYAEQQNLSAAIGDYNRLLTLTPENARAYYERGVIQTLRGNYEAALADLNQTVALDPHFALPYAVLGSLYQAQGNTQAARENYQKHLDLAGDEALEMARQGLQQLTVTATPNPET